MTDRQTFRFTVKEGTAGPWIAAEPLSGHIPALQDQLLGFDLQPGTEMADAAVLAALLNRTVSCVTLTSSKPDVPPIDGPKIDEDDDEEDDEPLNWKTM